MRPSSPASARTCPLPASALGSSLDGCLTRCRRRGKRTGTTCWSSTINRADLAKVLGEAIYLLEASEIAAGRARAVDLPFKPDAWSGPLQIPGNLYILGTMNSADRSTAILDLAVRRRFAFVDIWPDLAVVEEQGRGLATEAFARLQDVFAQFAPPDALVLMPGHAYFLAETESGLRKRLQYELMPLIREYLVEGRLGPCESELHAYLDWLEGELTAGGRPRAADG